MRKVHYIPVIDAFGNVTKLMRIIEPSELYNKVNQLGKLPTHITILTE